MQGNKGLPGIGGLYYWTGLLDWTRMAYTAVHLARAPENRQRQPAMLTFRHRYMYVVTEAYRMHKY